MSPSCSISLQDLTTSKEQQVIKGNEKEELEQKVQPCVQRSEEFEAEDGQTGTREGGFGEEK